MSPNPSILLARATGLVARAAGMVHAATDPDMRDALRVVELVARESVFWLHERPDADTVREIDAGLAKQAARLDEIEDKLRHNAGAKP